MKSCVPDIPLLRLCLILCCASLCLSASDFDDPNADREALPAVPEGFEVSFFAREPLVRQPCSMAFDRKGRLYVGMGPQYRNPTPETPGDSVVMVLDADGDNRADLTKTFATGFNAIQGLAWHGQDLWVANAPDLTVVRDLDGDDEADEYVLVYTDLGNLEHGLHGLNWAPDGKLYMSKGNSKGLTQPGRLAPKPFRELWGVTAPTGAPDFPAPRTFRKNEYRHTYHDPEDDWGREGGILRCDDGGGNLEIVSRGFRNPWDISFDSGFNWLGTDNDQTTGDRVFMPFYGAHFGWNHPWSAHWSTDLHPPTAPVSGPLFEGSGTGVVFGDSPQFPASHRGVFFINDWLRKTTFVWRPRWEGALMRPPGTWEPFVQGGKALFRPTDLEVGPDGALWILGWSRGYGAEFRNGEMTSEGRVFRVSYKGSPSRQRHESKRATPLSQWTVRELLEDFDGPLPVWRTDAQDELVRRGRAALSELQEIVARPQLNQHRETWLAWTIGRIATDDRAIDDWFATKIKEPATSLNFRVQALRILGHRVSLSGSDFKLPMSVIDALSSAEPRVRFAAAQAIAQTRALAARPALLEMLAVESDSTVFYAGWQALRRLTEPASLKPLLTDSRAGVQTAALLALLEDHALGKAEVEPLAKSNDATVRDIAALWLRKTVGGGEQMVVRGRPLEYRPEFEGVTIAPPTSTTTIDEARDLLAKGNAKRGQSIFHHPTAAGCFNCHRLEDHGNTFGPDLLALGDRANAAHIIQSILEPNAVITEGFKLQVVETSDAEYSGILLEESGLNVTLGLATGERQVIAKSKIVSRKSSTASAMPAYGAMLAAQDVADVAAYLLSHRSPSSIAAISSTPGSSHAPNNSLPRSQSGLEVVQNEDKLVITYGGRPACEFVFRDEKILRPYFANVHLPAGPKVTRNHPPVPELDATDHDTMHPGIWLAFGDISGVDFWRNKGRIEHIRFSRPPAFQAGRLTFETESRLTAPDGRTLGSLTNRMTLTARTDFMLLVWDATFHSETSDLVFGDQEEMGFGARVATGITEKSGGLITSSSGAKSARETWGQSADWCDYSGTVDRRKLGITLMAHPANFRKSWWHNRDYGVFVANPFGRAAMKQGEKSAVTVKRGETLRMRFGAAIHTGPDFNPAESHREFLRMSEWAGR
jgi:putative membrane-bound dehydrogenase-like protein